MYFAKYKTKKINNISYNSSLGGGLVGILPSTNFGASKAVFSSAVRSLSAVYSPPFATPGTSPPCGTLVMLADPLGLGTVGVCDVVTLPIDGPKKKIEKYIIQTVSKLSIHSPGKLYEGPLSIK